MRVENFPGARRQGACIRIHHHRRRLRGQCRGRDRAARRARAPSPGRSAAATTTSATASSPILAAEGIDCSGVVRVDGGTASVSLILLDADGREDHRDAPRLKVSARYCRRTPQQLVADVDAVLVDNRFPEFVTAVCRAAQARKHSDRARSRPGDQAGRSAARARHACDRLGRSAARRPPVRTTTARPWQRLAKHLTAFLAVTDGPNGVYWLDERRGPAHAGVQGDGDRYARRRRRLSRRLHACAGGGPRRSSTRCALPAPRPRSNARASAALSARRSAPRSRRF